MTYLSLDIFRISEPQNVLKYFNISLRRDIVANKILELSLCTSCKCKCKK